MSGGLLVLERNHREERTWENLYWKVVAAGRCSGCAGCVIACPYGELGYGREIPHNRSDPAIQSYCAVGESHDCPYCSSACPQLERQADEMDTMLFGRTRSELEAEFGAYQSICAARAANRDILSAGQDGGVVTALLIWALERGLIDGAVVSGLNTSAPWIAEPKVARSKEDLLAAARSRYTYSANPLALVEAARLGLEKVAFVGTPCHISPLRKLQLAGFSEELTKAVTITIGLLCSEAFTFDGLMVNRIQKGLGIALSEVVKVNIKGKVLVQTKSGEIYTIPLKEAKTDARPACQACADFSAEVADLSAGGVGTDGWTITITRTNAGGEFFRRAVEDGVVETRPMDEFPQALDILVRLARKQRERVRSNTAARP